MVVKNIVLVVIKNITKKTIIIITIIIITITITITIILIVAVMIFGCVFIGGIIGQIIIMTITIVL
jgi:hypothetical protein